MLKVADGKGNVAVAAKGTYAMFGLWKMGIETVRWNIQDALPRVGDGDRRTCLFGSKRYGRYVDSKPNWALNGIVRSK